jgi:predicted ferric reductase
LPVDKNISFHKGIAWTIAALATVHICSHYYNYYSISSGDLQALKNIRLVPGDAGANPTPNDLAFTSLPGWSGHLVTVIMLFMYTTAVSGVRRPMFEVFWFTHHLFILFFGILCFHGAGGILEPPNFWCWFIGPGVLYLIERIIRLVRGSQSTIILQAIQHPSKVLELRMKKTTFNYKPGQYVFLGCPYIARFEWHPFTISSSPDEDFLSVHIRIVGDWTGMLHRLLNPENKMGLVQENMLTAPNGRPIILVDGPFGAASEEAFKFENVTLWAAGIGVTPFASILKSIKYRIENADATCPIKSVSFYWVNRDTNSFEWFVDLLAELERKCSFLTINLYFTGTLGADQVRAVMYNAQGNTDSITGLEAKTIFGRPNLNQIFGETAQKFIGHRVGVFFCGPVALSKRLDAASRKFTNAKEGTKFIYHKENF